MNSVPLSLKQRHISHEENKSLKVKENKDSKRKGMVEKGLPKT